MKVAYVLLSVAVATSSLWGEEVRVLICRHTEKSNGMDESNADQDCRLVYNAVEKSKNTEVVGSYRVKTAKEIGDLACEYQKDRATLVVFTVGHGHKNGTIELPGETYKGSDGRSHMGCVRQKVITELNRVEHGRVVWWGLNCFAAQGLYNEDYGRVVTIASSDERPSGVGVQGPVMAEIFAEARPLRAKRLQKILNRKGMAVFATEDVTVFGDFAPQAVVGEARTPQCVIP